MGSRLEACFHLMESFRMLENIRNHSIVVARITQHIAAGLRQAGQGIGLERAVVGALLHDIGKTPSLNKAVDHAEVGRLICLGNGFEDVADIVGEHVILRGFDPAGPCEEKEIVYYADKRVNHDRIVNLQERLAYILERYGRERPAVCERIRANFEVCRQVEMKLFGSLAFGPEDLAEAVQAVTLGVFRTREEMGDAKGNHGGVGLGGLAVLRGAGGRSQGRTG